MSRHVIVYLRPGSDGDPTHRPKMPAYVEVDPPTLYLEKVGTQWMRSRGEARPGVTYSLERLPAGYAVYQRPRTSDPKVTDKFLYGHPSRRPFDSPNRFFPHFKYLMDNAGSNIGCPCTVCNAIGGIIPNMSTATGTKQASRNTSGYSTPKDAGEGSYSGAQFRGRPKHTAPGMDTSHVDEEGTPDVYRNLINKLRRDGAIDEPITEPMSMDWRAEQDLLPQLLPDLKESPQWLPRTGDIVLFVKELPKNVEICRVKTGFKLWDRESRTILGYPAWMAGVVGQTPLETVGIEDLTEETKKETNISYSGLRVEPLPDPNSLNKSLSKQYKYIPLHQVRPFVFWQDYLANVPQGQWHPTIKHALTSMATFSLVGKHRFRGTWPSATIYCHGMYIGSELLVVGDTIRLLPKSNETACTDVLSINSIQLQLSNLDKASENDYDEGRPYNSTVFISGRAYTLDAERSNAAWLTDNGTPQILHKYPQFYPLHPPGKEMRVPFWRALGRLFEEEAMVIWFPWESQPDDPIFPPDLGQGLDGVQEARAFAKESDKRIVGAFGTSWYWGDCRTEALDLQTVNGLEVAKYDQERDPKAWRKMIKSMEGAEKASRIKAAVGNTAGGGAQKHLSEFMAPATTLPLRHLGEYVSRPATSSDSASGSRPGTSLSGSSGKKRGKVINLSEDEHDEEDVRRQTVVLDENATPGKKRRVVIVID